MPKKLRWGILATGDIAKKFAGELANSRRGELVAVGSRSQASADAFGEQFNVPHRHGSYDALLADGDVDAVYIAPPHPMHARWAIRAAEAGKHILCEKPLTLNFAQAMAVVQAAGDNGVFLMEAFMYRCHPQIARLIELIRGGAIGEVRMIQASFGFNVGANPEERYISNKLGGGALLDVGCYTVSFARLIAGVALGRDFAEPIQVQAVGQLSDTNVDMASTASLLFEGGIIAQLTTAFAITVDNTARIMGTEGWIELPNPWLPAINKDKSNLIVHRHGEDKDQRIIVGRNASAYADEADVVARSLPAQQAKSPAMTWDDSLGNMKVLDQWRQAIGLIYDDEKVENQTEPIHGRSLAVPDKHAMKFARIEGIDKPVSRLVFGTCADWPDQHAAFLFDHWFENGGNAFDTAHLYIDGKPEAQVGQWLKTRGVREQVVIIGKGGHTPWCNPADINSQLDESLGRLQTDHMDIYMLHRDNLDYPVEVFIDLLNEHHDAGRFRILGCSNWTLDRIDQANAYAQRAGKMGFSVLSNNFSLARMVNPVWEGCLAVSDPDSRAWLERTQMPVLSWSSQARGFFTDLSGPDKPGEVAMRHGFYSDDNFERKRRATELAERKGVAPINIAATYVLTQPFPTFALIGPQLVSETASAITSLDVTITPDEARWLNLEE